MSAWGGGLGTSDSALSELALGVAGEGVGAPAGVATGSGSAHNASILVAPSAELASGTGSAHDATVSYAISTNANAGLAEGSGTAQTPSVSVVITAEVATGTGAARDAVAKVGGVAGGATGTGTAQGVDAHVAPSARRATGTGRAIDVFASDGSCTGAFQSSAFQISAFQSCEEGGDENPEDTETGVGVDDAYVEKGLEGVATAESGTGVDAAYVDKDAAGGPIDAESGVADDLAWVTKFPGGLPPALPSPPSIPLEVPVTIRYDGIDITSVIQFQTARFIMSVNGRAGSARFRVKDTGHDFEFVTGRTITLDVAGLRHWGGYVTSIRRGFYFAATDGPPSEIDRYFEIEAADWNVLFQRRVLYNKSTPTRMQLTTFDADTPDDEVLRHYIASHLDLSGDGLSMDLIEHVGTPSTDADISGAGGWTWNSFMQFITRNTGAIYYIDPDRRIALADVDEEDAPFGISDDPTGGEVGCSDFEIDFEGSNLRNDAMAWGMGQGSTAPVFQRVQDDDSIEAHQLWQVGAANQVVWRQATIDRIADSYVYGSPQNKRGGKDDAVGIRATIWEPGLRAGMKVNVRSAVFDYEDVIPVREMTVTFPTPYHPKYEMLLSHEIDPPWSTFEFWFPDFDFNFDFDFNIDLPWFDPCAPWAGDLTGDVSIGEVMGLPGSSLLIPSNPAPGAAPMGLSWSSPVFKFRYIIKTVDGVLRYTDSDDQTNILDPFINSDLALDPEPGSPSRSETIVSHLSGSGSRTLAVINPGVRVILSSEQEEDSAEWELWALWPEPDWPIEPGYPTGGPLGPGTPWTESWANQHPPGILITSSAELGPVTGDSFVEVGNMGTWAGDYNNPTGCRTFYAPKGVAILSVRCISFESDTFTSQRVTLLGSTGGVNNHHLKFAVPPPGYFDDSQCGEGDEGEFQDPPTGNHGEIMGQIATPSGQDPTSYWFETDHQYLSGSERVYLNGSLLRPGEDYQRHPVNRWIEILSSVSVDPGDVLSIDYEVFLSTPAPELL